MSWVSGEQKLSRIMFCHRSSTGSRNVTTFRGVDAPVFSCSCCCSLLLLVFVCFCMFSPVLFTVFGEVHLTVKFSDNKKFERNRTLQVPVPGHEELLSMELDAILASQSFGERWKIRWSEKIPKIREIRKKKPGCLGYIGDIKLPFGWDGRSDDREIRRSEKSEKKALVV